MNIFVLHTNPVLAARMQCDKHVVKMIVETTQMLSTIVGGPYKPTHVNHPCTIWARTSSANFDWLVNHGLALCREYTKRYGKRHVCQDIIETISFDDAPTDVVPTGELTPFTQCMPERFRQENPVLAYRAYYHSKSFAEWKRGRPAPDWWQPSSQGETNA